MQNIFDVYNFISFVADKYLQGYLSPEDVSSALDAGQRALFDFYRPQKQEGDSVANTALVPFLLRQSITTPLSGIAPYPADWCETDQVYGRVNGRLVAYNNVLPDEVEWAVNSVLNPISKYPRYRELAEGILLYPNPKVHTIDLNYLSNPTTPVIGYTLVGNTITYDPLTSVQLQFANHYWFKIVELSLPFVGVNLQMPDVAALYQLFQSQNAVAA